MKMILISLKMRMNNRETLRTLKKLKYLKLGTRESKHKPNKFLNLPKSSRFRGGIDEISIWCTLITNSLPCS